MEKLLDTPARIYYKYEGVSPAGSHKPNTSVPQAWYNKQAGVKKVVTETGAGQWGSALAFASSLFGLECEVWNDSTVRNIPFFLITLWVYLVIQAFALLKLIDYCLK